MLTGSARKYLRGLAHGLRPLVQVGKDGLSDTVLAAIDAALEAHELVKVQIAAERDERRAMTETMAAKLECECVGQIGRMTILFRQQADPERRAITLPRE
jgi:RNA-binding protein